MNGFHKSHLFGFLSTSLKTDEAILPAGGDEKPRKERDAQILVFSHHSGTLRGPGNVQGWQKELHPDGGFKELSLKINQI